MIWKNGPKYIAYRSNSYSSLPWGKHVLEIIANLCLVLEWGLLRRVNVFNAVAVLQVNSLARVTIALSA